MSHFEYVSIAIALVYALPVGRLLSGLSLSMTADRRYWVHTTWVSTLLLVCVMSWWTMWRLNEVSWTPIRFLWILSLPALLYVRANILLGRPGDEPDSYHDHFYEKRKLFFSIGIGVAAWIALSPWLLEILPWFEPGPVHVNAISLLSVSILGLCFRNTTVHAVLAVVSFIGAASGFALIQVIA